MPIYQSQKLRRYRSSESGRPYLLTTATLGRLPIFPDLWLGRLLVMQMREAHHQGLVQSLAWVIMPDHLHWLVELRVGSLDGLMRQVKSKSTKSINRRIGRSGALWQSGFHDRALRREEDMKAVARYIVANPLRAGLARNIEDYSLWDACWV